MNFVIKSLELMLNALYHSCSSGYDFLNFSAARKKDINPHLEIFFRIFFSNLYHFIEIESERVRK